jgi:hypothetical protein
VTLTYVQFSDLTGNQPSLEISIVAVDAGHSAMRADAVVVWLDPQPYPDSAIRDRPPNAAPRGQ